MKTVQVQDSCATETVLNESVTKLAYLSVSELYLLLLVIAAISYLCSFFLSLNLPQG